MKLKNNVITKYLPKYIIIDVIINNTDGHNNGRKIIILTHLHNHKSSCKVVLDTVIIKLDTIESLDNN